MSPKITEHITLRVYTPMCVYTRYIFVSRVGPYLSLLLTLTLCYSISHVHVYRAHLVSLRK